MLCSMIKWSLVNRTQNLNSIQRHLMLACLCCVYVTFTGLFWICICFHLQKFQASMLVKFSSESSIKNIQLNLFLMIQLWNIHKKLMLVIHIASDNIINATNICISFSILDALYVFTSVRTF